MRPQKTHPCVISHHFSHHMRKSIKGSNLQTCLKTIYKLRNFCYILPICTEASHRRICTKFGTGVGVAAIMTSDKYFGEGLRSVVFVGGSNFTIGYWKAQSPFTRDGATGQLVIHKLFNVFILICCRLYIGFSDSWDGNRAAWSASWSWHISTNYNCLCCSVYSSGSLQGVSHITWTVHGPWGSLISFLSCTPLHALRRYFMKIKLIVCCIAKNSLYGYAKEFTYITRWKWVNVSSASMFLDKPGQFCRVHWVYCRFYEASKWAMGAGNDVSPISNLLCCEFWGVL